MARFRIDTFGDKLRFFGPDNQQIDSRPLVAEKVKEFVDAIEKKYTGSRSVTTTDGFPSTGQKLYEWLDGPTSRWLDKARKKHTSFTVDLQLNDELQKLPWELLHDGSMFLCPTVINSITPIRRMSDVSGADINIPNRPLRVLFMACSPNDVEPVLDFEAEESRILAATRNQQIELVVEESGSLRGLTDRISWHGEDYFDVLHLTGHAVAGETPTFLMEDYYGDKKPVTADEISRELEARWPRLVFLSGCQTAKTSTNASVPSLCEALIQAGAHAVLGWSLSVQDECATVAATELYKNIAQGKRIDKSITLARAKLHQLKSDEWHLLRLYTDATDPTSLVTAPGSQNRERLHIRQAHTEFWEAGSKLEVCPKDLFVGRRRPIQRCLQRLHSEPEDCDYCTGVLLHGMGGLGKSSLAARLCERMPSYKRLVWVGKLDENAILQTLNNILNDPEVIKQLNDSALSLKKRLKRLLTEYLSTKPVLFVFDDFEQNCEGHDTKHYRFDEDNRTILESSAQSALRDVMEAIHETTSNSRVIVTCRYRFPSISTIAKLHEESLEHLTNANLAKKVKQLNALKPNASTDETIRKKATNLGAGNPRLLERLNCVLEDKNVDSDAILRELETTAEDFREDTLLKLLFEQQTPECRKLIAMLAVCNLPIDLEAVKAVAGDDLVAPHLEQAISLGLIEGAPDQSTGKKRYYCSEILNPLLETELNEEEKKGDLRSRSRTSFRGLVCKREQSHNRTSP